MKFLPAAALRIAYQKFAASRPDIHVFHPYFLKEFNGRWYVPGHSDRKNKVITFALDRIESADAEPVH